MAYFFGVFYACFTYHRKGWPAVQFQTEAGIISRRRWFWTVWQRTVCYSMFCYFYLVCQAGVMTTEMANRTPGRQAGRRLDSRHSYFYLCFFNFVRRLLMGMGLMTGTKKKERNEKRKKGKEERN